MCTRFANGRFFLTPFSSYNVIKSRFNKIRPNFNVENINFSTTVVRKIFTSNELSKKSGGEGSSGEKKCALNPAGLVLGLYVYDTDIHGGFPEFTPSGEKMNDRLNGKILDVLRDGASPMPRVGEVRKLFDLDDQFPLIAVVGLGDPCKGYNPVEQLDEKKENIRIAAATGARAVQEHTLQYIVVDSMNHAESAAEGASMAVWMYQDLKDPQKQRRIPKVECFDSNDHSGWSIGLHKAAAQNLARFLCETPGNQLTPSLFTQTTVELLSKCGVNVNVRMKHWAKLRNFHAFLTVAKGSCEEPIILEMLYEGCDPDICPIVLIGKGVTFDSGGICLRKCDDMEHARGDMSGAATVVATMRAISALRLPINVVGLVPMCENLPGATAVHPGSVVKNVADKTILIRNTDDEGVLMLSDVLTFAKEFKPKFIIDVGNFTPQARRAMGSGASIVFSNSESLYETIRIASIHSGDRVWRFPLWWYFNEYVRNINYADIKNLQSAKDGGGPCQNAAFLREFLKIGCLSNIDWMHVDTFGVTTTSGKVFKYLRKGMSGRPVRTIIEMMAQLACINQKKETKCGA